MHWDGNRPYSGAEQANLEKDLEKKRIYESIASIRHAENRSMKEDAIQHYKNNHKSYTDKNDAAFKIAGNNIPARFASVPDWLKGINPE